jgi:ketosteroid isomerase-like protein
MNAETEIRRIIDARAAAVRIGDVDAMLADVAERVMVFDVVDPLRRVGRECANERTNGWRPTTAPSPGRIATRRNRRRRRGPCSAA